VKPRSFIISRIFACWSVDIVFLPEPRQIKAPATATTSAMTTIATQGGISGPLFTSDPPLSSAHRGSILLSLRQS